MKDYCLDGSIYTPGIIFLMSILVISEDSKGGLGGCPPPARGMAN